MYTKRLTAVILMGSVALIFLVGAVYAVSNKSKANTQLLTHQNDNKEVLTSANK